jgi:glucose-6-phosphate dehydrogenase assembly protein OpcA
MADLVVLDSSSRDEFGAEVFCDGDLTWPRLLGWRSAVARFLAGCDEFDPAHVEQIEIAGRPAASQLLAGWLAYLLHGRMVRSSGEMQRIEFPPGRTVDFGITSGPGSLCGLDSVTLRLAGGGAVSLRAEDTNRLWIEARFSGQRIETHSSVRRLSFAEEVALIVHSHGADEVYGPSRRLALAIPHGGTRV